MKILRIFALTAFFLTAITHLSQAQMLGGHINWTCHPSGAFVFELVKYTNCSSVILNPDTLFIQSDFGNIMVLKTDSNFASLSCPSSASAISCDTLAFFTPVYRYMYRSAPINLISQVSITGWNFYYTEGGRPAADNLASGSGYTIRSVMYAPGAQPGTMYTAPCVDNAPMFWVQPQYAFNQSSQFFGIEAWENDVADSLFFTWAEPWDSGSVFPPNPVVFDTAYSFTQPLPGFNLNPQNEEPVLTSAGVLTFRSVTTGQFASCIKIESWRNGQIISEIYRDLLLEVNQDPGLPGLCSGNLNTFPFVTFSSIGNYQAPIGVFENFQFSHYRLDVMAGDTVKFNINANDFNLSPNCNAQEITMGAYGSAINPNLTVQQPCAHEPCAQLISLNPGNVFTRPQTNSVQFDWATDTAHVPGAAGVGIHTFFINATDDNCILPGVGVEKILIFVNRPIALSATALPLCQGDTATLIVSGDVTNLSWSPATGISCTNCPNPLVYPAASTLYTVTDLNTGFTASVQVNVDPLAPSVQFVQQGSNFVVTNASVYDTIIWFRNGAPFYAGSSHTPQLSGDYNIMAIRGACQSISNPISYGNGSNIAASAFNSGVWVQSPLIARNYANTVRLQNEPFYTINGFYLHAFDKNQQGANLSQLQAFVRDDQQSLVFSSDSVARISQDLLFFYGEATLAPNTDYLMGFSLDTSVIVPLFKPTNFPVVTTNGRLQIFNALVGTGTGVPNTSSTEYPFYHISLKWGIGVDENMISRFDVYPNPASDILMLQSEEPFAWQMTDATGRELLAGTGESTQTADVRHLPSGLYFIRIQSNNYHKVMKVMISR